MSCCCQQNAKVNPTPGSNEDIVELRPGRMIHIQHLNRRKRTESFSSEMDVFMNFKKNGMLPNLAVNLSASPHKNAEDQHKVSQDKISSEDSQKIDNANYNDAMSAHQSENKKHIPESLSQSRKENGSNLNENYLNNEEARKKFFSPVRDRNSRPNTEKSVVSWTEHDRKSIMSASNVEVAVENKPKQMPTSRASVIEEKDETESVRSSVKSSLKSQKKTKNYKNANDKLNGSSSFKHSSSANNGPKCTDTVLFFIHGVGGCSDLWKPQMTFFSNLGYEIVAPDMIGHGLSCGPRHKDSYHFQEIMADLEELFDRYCKQSNILIGHSYG